MCTLWNDGEGCWLKINTQPEPSITNLFQRGKNVMSNSSVVCVYDLFIIACLILSLRLQLEDMENRTNVVGNLGIHNMCLVTEVQQGRAAVLSL